jgi:hypothetical protein
MAFILAGTEQYNLPRMLDKRSGYEVYYLRFTDPKQQIGLWYRQTFLIPEAGEPEASIWWMIYDLAHPHKNFAWRKTVPLSETRIERDMFYFSVSGGEIYHKGSHGSLKANEKKIEWRLVWEPGTKAFKAYPAPFYFLPFPKTKFLSPNPVIAVTGELKWGERRYQFDGIPGEQSHVWGRRHAHSWTWGSTTFFAGTEKVLFQGLSARVPLGRKISPPLSLFYLRVGDKEYSFRQPWQWTKNNSHSSSVRWHFSAETRRQKITGDVFLKEKDLIGVTYTDPDASQRYCYHCENATLHLKIYNKFKRAWELSRELQSLPAMAYEFVTSEPIPNIPLKI